MYAVPGHDRPVARFVRRHCQPDHGELRRGAARPHCFHGAPDAAVEAPGDDPAESDLVGPGRSTTLEDHRQDAAADRFDGHDRHIGAIEGQRTGRRGRHRIQSRLLGESAHDVGRCRCRTGCRWRRRSCAPTAPAPARAVPGWRRPRATRRVLPDQRSDRSRAPRAEASPARREREPHAGHHRNARSDRGQGVGHPPPRRRGRNGGLPSAHERAEGGGHDEHPDRERPAHEQHRGDRRPCRAKARGHGGSRAGTRTATPRWPRPLPPRRRRSRRRHPWHRPRRLHPPAVAEGAQRDPLGRRRSHVARHQLAAHGRSGDSGHRRDDPRAVTWKSTARRVPSLTIWLESWNTSCPPGSERTAAIVSSTLVPGARRTAAIVATMPMSG